LRARKSVAAPPTAAAPSTFGHCGGQGRRKRLFTQGYRIDRRIGSLPGVILRMEKAGSRGQRPAASLPSMSLFPKAPFSRSRRVLCRSTPIGSIREQGNSGRLRLASGQQAPEEEALAAVLVFLSFVPFQILKWPKQHSREIISRR
jgi:hypothetical protein